MPVTHTSGLSPAEAPQLLPAACTAPTFPPSSPKLLGTQQQTSEQEPAAKDVAKLPLTATDTAEVLDEEGHLPPRARSGREARGGVTDTGARAKTRRGCQSTFSLPGSTYGEQGLPFRRSLPPNINAAAKSQRPPPAPHAQPHVGVGRHRAAPHGAHLDGQELLHRAVLLLTAQQQHPLHPTPLPKLCHRATGICDGNSEPSWGLSLS